MSALRNLPAWIERASLLFGAYAVFFVCAAALGNRHELLDFRSALHLFTWGTRIAFTAACVSLAALVLAYVPTENFGRLRVAAGVFVVSVAIFVQGYAFETRARHAPRIHDITTDPEEPPTFDAILPLRAAAANSAFYAGPELARAQRAAYPDIAPITLPLPYEDAFARALTAARALGWRIVDSRPETGYIEATDSSFFFGFKDDVVVRVRAVDEANARIDLRSVSRVGQGDAGANAARIRRFAKEIRGPFRTFRP